MLAELVQQGKLPPVDQRLPKNPVVLTGMDGVGKYGGTMRRGFRGFSDRWGPTKIQNEGLTWYNPDLSIRANIVELWEVSSDARQWTFKLREGMKWSDGSDLTTDDWKWWYENVLLNDQITPILPEAWSTGSPRVAMKAEFPDRYTAVFTFQDPKPLFVYNVTRQQPFVHTGFMKQFHASFTDLAKLEADAKAAGFETWVQLFQDKNAWWAVGRPSLGPWTPVNTMTEQLFIMERNPYFWQVDEAGNQLPYIDKITHLLLRLCEAFAGDGDLSRVPNLIYRDGDAIRVTARKEPEKIGALPLPDFDGLPLDRYLAPHLTLPLLAARGCYFGKCAFCNVGYGEAENFSLMRSEMLAEQMVMLHRRYGTQHIFFSDEALTPRTLRELSRIPERDGVPVSWGGGARFEKTLTADLVQQMYRGGCRMILFGLESASEAIMDRMVKGTKLEHMHRILRESTAAGIWNHTFALGSFLLEIDAPAHRFPESFGITRVIDPPEKDLAIYFDYEVAEGMDAAMAELVETRFMETMPVKPFPQFYVNDVYRFLYACHLSRQGAPLPPLLARRESGAAAMTVA